MLFACPLATKLVLSFSNNVMGLFWMLLLHIGFPLKVLLLIVDFCLQIIKTFDVCDSVFYTVHDDV